MLFTFGFKWILFGLYILLFVNSAIHTLPLPPILQNSQPLCTQSKIFPTWRFIDKSWHLRGRVWKNCSQGFSFQYSVKRWWLVWYIKWVHFISSPLHRRHQSLLVAHGSDNCWVVSDGMATYLLCNLASAHTYLFPPFGDILMLYIWK